MLHQLLQIAFSAPVAGAQSTLQVSSFGFGNASFASIMGSLFTMLSESIIYISSAAFVVGAAVYIISVGDESRRSQGKNMMTGSLIGLALVLSAKAILDTIMYFLYG